MSLWLWILVALWAIYSFMYLYFITKIYFHDMRTQKALPKAIKEKYFMFVRPEVENIIYPSMILCGLTLGCIRFYMFILILFIYDMTLRLVWCG